ncbi:MAG: FmdB family zinc ribbon protein, partial [Candidatus Omnitrophota bacterium]
RNTQYAIRNTQYAIRNTNQVMPTYEYECLKCGYKFEKFQSITAAPLKRCPKCGKGIKRLIGLGAGIIFKGSGFYATDYRSSGYKKKEKAEKPDVCPQTKKGCDPKNCPKANT